MYFLKHKGDENPNLLHYQDSRRAVSKKKDTDIKKPFVLAIMISSLVQCVAIAKGSASRKLHKSSLRGFFKKILTLTSCDDVRKCKYNGDTFWEKRTSRSSLMYGINEIGFLNHLILIKKVQCYSHCF